MAAGFANVCLCSGQANRAPTGGVRFEKETTSAGVVWNDCLAPVKRARPVQTRKPIPHVRSVRAIWHAYHIELNVRSAESTPDIRVTSARKISRWDSQSVSRRNHVGLIEIDT